MPFVDTFTDYTMIQTKQTKPIWYVSRTFVCQNFIERGIINFMYWRQSIPLFGGLKYNRTSNGKDYISYRKNGMYIREPVADIKKDIKNLFHPGQRTLDVNEVQKKSKIVLTPIMMEKSLIRLNY